MREAHQLELFMQDMAHWQSLCDLLCPGDPSLAHDVLLAISDPAKYFVQFTDMLCERGIERAEEVSPWIALVDGLESRGYLKGFDWKLEVREVSLGLCRLVPCKLRGVTFPSLFDTDSTGDAILMLAAADAMAHDISLLHLDIGCDSYEIVPVPTDKAPEIQRLAALLDQDVVRISME